MRNILFLLLLAFGPTAGAQIYLVDTNASYFEDFNSMDSFGTGSSTLPQGWTFNEFGSAANTTYRAGTGSATTSDTYSFGPLRSRDRALGSLASGTLTKVVYGTMFINQTGSDINSMRVTYRGEQWRRGGSGTADSLRCYFTTVPRTHAGDSSNARWTEAPGLLFRSVSTLSGGATLNGNDSSQVLQADIPLMLHPGDTLWLRWMDTNAAGSDDGLAIDSLGIQFRNGAVALSNHPVLISFSPDSNASGLAPDLQLRLGFDRAVTPGSGYVSVWNLGTNNIDRIPAVNGQVATSGRELVFTGIHFEPGAKYIVRFDSSAFDSLGFRCSGLYTIDWNFRVAPVAVSGHHLPSSLEIDPTADGLLVLRSAAPFTQSAMLRIFSLEGRMLRNEMLRVSPGTRIIETGLPQGGCYSVSLLNADVHLRRMLCIP